jgi:multidrug resistance protein, MATE family
VVFGIVGLCEGWLFTHQVVNFISNSSAVRAASIFPMRVMGVATPLIAVALILSEGLFGAGSTRFVAAAQAVMVFGWLVPGAYLIGVVLHRSLDGIWIAAAIYACIAATVMSVKFAGGGWKRIVL